MYKTELYFESHITIEPILEDDRFEILKNLAKQYNFRVADLFMRKGGKNQDNSFMTARSKDYSIILDNTLKLVEDLQKAHFKVYRHKIENTLVDVHY